MAQPLDEITPRDVAIKNDPHAGADWKSLKTQLWIILSLTLFSAFNYISLTLARAFSRAQEVGVRKTIGATRGQIMGQFLVESTVVALIALIFTLPWVRILMHYIPDMHVGFSWDGTLILGLLAYAILTGLVAGAFPSWLLSAFQPIQILRKLKNFKLFRGVAFYKGILVVQFSVTIVLMILVVTLVDYEIKNSSIINSTVSPNVLTLELKGEKHRDLQHEIAQLSQVQATMATDWYYKQLKMGKATLKSVDKLLDINYVSIDPKVIDLEGIRLISGQNFPNQLPQGTEQFILVNQTAAMLLAKEPGLVVGQDLLLDSAYVQVIGIMPDEVVGQTIPMVYRYLPEEVGTLAVKINPDAELEVTKAIQALWNSRFPDKTAHIQNLKDDYIGKSSKERLSFFGLFALIVMIIASLGILGIASYSVETRAKELGIRRVLGASDIKLIWTITGNFGLLLLLSGLIGIPAGLFGANLLRQDMGTQVDLSVLNVSIGFISVAVVGLLTVLSQTVRASRIEPVKVLKSE